MRPETRGSYDYEILSDLERQHSPGRRGDSLRTRPKHSLRGFPKTSKARFRQIALPFIQNVQGKGPETTTARARALESYLRESGQFWLYTQDERG